MRDALRSHRVEIAVCLLLVAGVAPFVLGAGSASATTCAPAFSTTAEYRDGGWWVFRPHSGCGDRVVRYDERWKPTGEKVRSARIEAAMESDAFDEVIDVQATETGWLVFREDGYVYRMNRSFGDAEYVRTLPGTVYGGVRGPAGNWWVETHNGVRVIEGGGIERSSASMVTGP